MTETTTTTSELLSEVAVKGLQEKKGLDIVRMDLRDADGAITDYFVICSGTSDRHVQALSKSVDEVIRKELKDKPINTEGYTTGEWILIDYVDVVIHIFQREKRTFYDIEGLWGDAEVKSYENVY